MDYSESKPWPVDIETLQKGDSISPEIIETWSNTSRDSKAYSLAVLKLISHIDDRLRNQGKDYAIMQKKDSIVILTDEQASVYLADMQRKRMSGLCRDHRKLLSADVNNIADKSGHERRMLASSFITQALTTVRKRIRLIPYKKENLQLPERI